MENDKINMKKNKNILSIILLIFMLFSLICSNSFGVKIDFGHESVEML